MSLSDFLNNRRRKKSGATRGSLKKEEFKKLSKTASGKRMQGGAGARVRKARKSLAEAGAVTEAQAAKKARPKPVVLLGEASPIAENTTCSPSVS